jgi:hypothetical protein
MYFISRTLCESGLERIQAAGTDVNIKEKNVRDCFAKYSTSPQGTSPWQYDYA